MRFVVAGLCVVATLLLMAASINMNWLFWTGQGADQAAGRTLGLVSIAIDLFKAALPLVIAWSWHERRWLGVGVGVVFLALCLTFSVSSAFGFASTSREVLASKRDSQAAHRAQLQSELKRLTALITQLKNPRPKLVLEEMLAKQRQDRRWLSTNECRDPANETGRSFCKEMSDLRIEVASFTELAELTKLRDSIQAQLTNLEASGPVLEKDVQASPLSRLTGWGTEPIKLALTSLVALAVEFGAAFGLFFASIASGEHNPTPTHKAQAARVAPTIPLRLPAGSQLQQIPKRLVCGPDGHLMVE